MSDTRDTPLVIEQPETHWVMSYIPLVPSIHPPTTHDRGDLIQVWLKLPPGGQIDVRWLEDQERPTLVYPDGTHADRVEYFRVDDSVADLVNQAPFVAGKKPAEVLEWTVADVRATRLVNGRQWFHVYRPADSTKHATLYGWQWPRDDVVARQHATERMLEHVSRHAGALEDEPTDDSAMSALRKFNDCASCHVPNEPRIRVASNDRLVERATDSLGFIVPNAVLQDDCVVADHRPEDINIEDRFVSVYCADGRAAKQKQDNDGEWLACEDGSQPRGRRDIKAGMLADHPYTRAVCASRNELFRHMTPAARDAYANAFTVCGIGQ